MKNHSKTSTQRLGVTALLLALAASAHAGPRTSTDYTVPADTADAGGQRATSSAYTNDGSLGGITGISTVASPAQTAKAGYVGQLYDPSTLTVTAASSNVNETGTVQLSGVATMDDGTLLNVDAASVAWSVLSGPLTGIDAAGLATAGVVYQDTLATAQGSYLGVSDTVNVTVLDTIPDNFGGYAGDKLPDLWQVDNFGNPPNPDAAPGANPEGDPYNNLFEFGSGTDPNAPTGLLTVDLGAGTFTPGAPVVHVEFSPLRVTYRFVRVIDFAGAGLVYTPTFSHGLVTFEPSSAVPTVLLQDLVTGYELVEVPFTLFLSDGQKAKFSQLEIDLP